LVVHIYAGATKREVGAVISHALTIEPPSLSSKNIREDITKLNRQGLEGPSHSHQDHLPEPPG